MTDSLRTRIAKPSILKKLLDDLFAYTRLTSTNMKLDLKPVDIHDLIHQLLFEFEPIAMEHGVSIVRDCSRMHAVVMIDSDKFVRALDNLLMNALKYTIKPGSIRVYTQLDETNFYVTVENNAEPITKEQEVKLFDSFYEVDDSRQSEQIQTGSGLGLSIAKNITELHGGTLGLTHQDGVYQFTVRMPRGSE
ncbi:sensor histidine kinase [Paenibacillus roseipurpureus]|uniref:sensor histidine kinase n=1 Tax=Paenibacillus roseopurpureus TaxID=2918901 RepID=UPI0028E25910|nr:ATP-binding protein [Paenibacillus sp. MBLB1832]